ncbi:MAG: RNA polymerase sigma factor, partial [Cellulosilyticaceae bacterium]
MKHQEIAMDLVQDTIVSALEKSYSLKSIGHVKPWVYRILVNLCLTHLKKKNRCVQLEDYQELLVSYPIDSDMALSLYKEVDQLSIKLKTVILLRYFQDMKIEEIAYILAVPQSTVKSRIKRALSQLGEKVN